MRHGVTCPRTTPRGRRCIGGSAGGSVMAPGPGSWPGCKLPPMRPGGSTGPSASTPRSAAPINTPPVPVVTATSRKNHRAGSTPSPPIMRWAVRGAGGPPRLTSPANRAARFWPPSSRPGTAVTARSSPQSSTASELPAAVPAGPGLDRSRFWRTGPTRPGQPCLSAPPGNQGLYPEQDRPRRPSPGQRLPRRPATRLQPGDLPPTPRRGVRHQPAQTTPRHGHPLRQTRRALRSHPDHRRH